jgi:hypothetical protein
MGGDRPRAYLKYSIDVLRSNFRLRQNSHLSIGDGRVIEFREFSDTFDVVEQALGRWLVV